MVSLVSAKKRMFLLPLELRLVAQEDRLVLYAHINSGMDAVLTDMDLRLPRMSCSSVQQFFTRAPSVGQCMVPSLPLFECCAEPFCRDPKCRSRTVPSGATCLWSRWLCVLVDKLVLAFLLVPMN